MRFRAAERKRARQSAESIDDPMTRDDARFGIDVQRIADRPRRARIADHRGDLSVRRNFAVRNTPYDLVYQSEKRRLLRAVCPCVHGFSIAHARRKVKTPARGFVSKFSYRLQP